MSETDIAVVGMGCRLPGAHDLDAFWRMLRDGRDARRELSDEHLRSVGVPDDVLADPDFVKAAMLLDDIDMFDAGFFGLSPRDASLFDPQHRIWLEVCWEAFEHAGHVPQSFDGRVGVFAGCGMDTYLLHNVLTNPDLVRQIGMFLIRHTGNDKDFLATRTSYQFDLRGPSINVVTACSTSLVAIHQAAASLLSGECDMALAGGVTVLVPQDRGYLHKEGEVLSPDGVCRTFDADSKGTIFGSGAGVVVLRRLQDALDDGDHIHAVVSGTAVNNDGARKVSFLAPSVDGYAEVVAEALALSDVEAEDVQYIEAHGTGTSVGDPMEIEALTQAFRASTSKSDFCGIGSVKTNIGHLDTAAGVAGVLKVALAMKHGELPASLNYRRSNPLIDFPKSPFHVVAEKTPWPRPANGERTAGVSSLGVGGTNAHIIMRESLEQAAVPAVAYPRRCHLLPISGKGKDAAVGNAGRMAEWLGGHENSDLGDVAWTMQHGRRGFSHRGFAVGADHNELRESLLAADWKAQVKKATDRTTSVVFLFPGGGAQYPGMAKELYEFEPAFRTAADNCLAALPDGIRNRVYDLLFGAATQAENGLEMERPSLLLPTLFVVEYSLAETIRSFGIEPDAMLGHSLGEYVAATLGGTWTLEQVLPVLVLRGECMEMSAAGAVVSVSLPAAEIQALGDAELSLSAANAPGLSAVAGSPAAIERFEQSLKERDVDFQRLRIGVGAHSHLLDTVLDRFREGLKKFTPQPAKKLWVSNVTGEWIDPNRAADREYWVEHVRRTVRFEDGVSTLLDGGDRVFVEVGPGKALTSLVRMHERARKSSALVTVPHPKDEKPADSFFLEAIGRLWQIGVPIDWQAFHGGVKRRRVALPTYAFQRQRHWIEPGTSLGHDNLVANKTPTVPTRLPASQWLKKTEWRRRDVSSKVEAVANAHWLCVGGGAVAEALANSVRATGGKATVVIDGAECGQGDALSLPLGDAAAWGRAVDSMTKRSGDPTHVMYAAALDQGSDDAIALVSAQIAMLQALGRAGHAEELRIVAVTSNATVVANEALLRPFQGAVPGMLRVVPREFPGARVCWVDADAATLATTALFADCVRLEAEASSVAMGVAFRDVRRFVQELVAVEVAEQPASPWRARGTFLITGGLGGIGMLVAEHLARTCKAKLVLVSRSGLPPRANWDEWLQLRSGDRVAELIRRIRAMEQVGAEVAVAAADVTDRVAMQGVVQTATTRFGGLHGVVHAAGVLHDGLIMTRKPEQTERLMRPKVVGAQVLDEVTADIRLDQFIVFGSTSGLVGIPGQCDYAAANAALDTFAEWRSQKRQGRTLSVDWGIWQDAGMLATAAEMSLPTPTWLGERSELGGTVLFQDAWSPSSHWILAEHRIKDGDCVMPGTGHIEVMTAAVQSVASAAQVTLTQVEFRTPLAFPGDAPRTVLVSVKPHRDGFEVTVASCEPHQKEDYERTTHARAIAKVGAVGAALLDVAACRTVATTSAEATSDQHQHVDFGPRWQCITSVAIGGGEVLGELSLPAAFFEDLEQHRVHPAMLDMAFGCGIRLLSSNSPDALFVPVGCEQVLVHGRMPAAVVSHVKATSYDERTRLGTLDVTIATPAGVIVLELRGLSVFGVSGQFGGNMAATGTRSPESLLPAEPLAPAPEQRIDAVLARGITGPEGMLGLERALEAGAARIVVSSMDVQRTANWLSLPPEQPRIQRAASSGGSGAGDEDAPRDATEKAVAAAFHDLLGVEEPALDDDFFELGGHSLLAVRLFARLHKEFRVDMELATLLSSGTVRKLAAALREELNLPEPSDEPVRSVAARKGQHVVPIQASGSRPSLFLVHGAGGNVLGFRDLSHYFGKDQPLYGLQARGVDGKVEPHQTIAEMAAAYLAELREVQPHGPYYLGGYSGGGVVAYEMAQLLRAVGEPVAFVGMIDSWCPQMKRRSKISRTLLHLGRLIKKGPLYPWRIVKARIDRRAAARDTEKAREQGGAIPQEQRGFEVQFAFENAFETHQVKPYEGNVWLFRADDQRLGTRFVFDAHLGWRPFVQGDALSVRACPGNHYTMCTEPNVQVLCQHMMAGMDEAMAAAGSAKPQ
ncbi:MAG: acyl transferase domain-containing protein [Planctomycetota bacterium]|jgi:acyl transferase domain-containing protein